MDHIRPTRSDMINALHDQRVIRNVCILAHVDHGKTSVADLLLATNNIVSQQFAGHLRFMDDRPDERARGITMKASVVSLLNTFRDDTIIPIMNKKILLNLVDTPGHIDFSAEVGTAVRICDGAFIVIDAAEGVCAQTREAIKIAYYEQLTMVLVINKMDRLFVELDLQDYRVFQALRKIIEDCNVIIADLVQHTNNYGKRYDMSIEDTGLLFSPETGNVIFGSAIDGWAFTTKQMAQVFTEKLPTESCDSLNKKLWNFDYWVDRKGVLRTGAVAKKKANIFTQFCIQSIMHVYHTVGKMREEAATHKIIKKLKLTKISKVMLSGVDPRLQIRAILSEWKPFALSLLLQAADLMPCPFAMKKSRIEYLLDQNRYVEKPFMNKCNLQVSPLFQRPRIDSPIICYITKIICIPRKLLYPGGTDKFPGRWARAIKGRGGSTSDDDNEISTDNNGIKNTTANKKKPIIADEYITVGLAKSFAGWVNKGAQLYILHDGYEPTPEVANANIIADAKISTMFVQDLFMFYGKELMSVNRIPAGNIFGITGFTEENFCGGTLSSSKFVVPLIEIPFTPPVVKYAIEPKNPQDLPALRAGLKLLSQTDRCVQVSIKESGELIMNTSGNVHLEKCMEDLLRQFVRVELQISRPMIALRETVLLTKPIGGSILSTPNITMNVGVVALPPAIITLLNENHELFNIIEEHQKIGLIDLIKLCMGVRDPQVVDSNQKQFVSSLTTRAVERLKIQLWNPIGTYERLWHCLHNKIWSVNKMRGCPNLLINNTNDYGENIFRFTNNVDIRNIFIPCILNAFEEFTSAGPLCHEPITNCAFVIYNFKMKQNLDVENITLESVAAEETAIRAIFQTAFYAAQGTLMEPFYGTEIHGSQQVLGQICRLVTKYNGNVLDNVKLDAAGQPLLLEAEIPIIGSEGFPNEIRTVTSGRANPTLALRDFRIIEDGLRAERLRREVRRRKGLNVEEEVVVHAEKQRTLNKKK